ncbi:MAG: hypothetical protein Q4D37_03945 [Oscillospiraceae bacterium]|nr:hypothetical protein [Oscillospiraceae bacterium]
MPKNVMVQDAAGHTIGSTYLRRAKGLLKSGRAVLVDDHTIQLRASAQNAAAPENKKEQNMEQEILFCAKAFYQKSETGCSLLTMGDANGESMEVWELDGEAAPAVIIAELQQLPLTDYVLRFAVLGSAASEILRCTIKTAADTKTYALEQGRYQPQYSRKTADGTLLRVYALPVQTDADGAVTVEMMAKQAAVQVLPIQPESVYAALPPYDYSDWKQETASANKAVINLANAKLPKSALLQILANCGEQADVNLENADIYNDME